MTEEEESVEAVQSEEIPKLNGGDIKNEVQFSTKVDKAINELMPNSEIYDDPSFNPIDYINEKFPTGMNKNEKKKKINFF